MKSLFWGVIWCGFGFMLIFGLVNEAIQEQHKWDTFSAEHHCKISQVMPGSTTPITGFDSNGNVTTAIASTPSRTAYLCDDGVTYWR